ncbi:hypothetical protein [Sorangium sp. So ce513]|uniref:hypothetical protein n=1 Tax=Sorangium sp. So ce513 TaxID=3133315 RepID=UPI003F615593
MADRAQIDAWLRQAKADLQAGRTQSDDVSEDHRRYWLQQCCEKALKALGLLLWRGPASDDGMFRAHFLHKHSPLKELQQAAALPKSLKLLLREIEVELGKIDGAALLRKVDATTPTVDPTGVSYRYPFRAASGQHVAPCEWVTADWDGYQGNALGITAALDRFIKAVENAVKRQQRGPS